MELLLKTLLLRQLEGKCPTVQQLCNLTGYSTFDVLKQLQQLKENGTLLVVASYPATGTKAQLYVLPSAEATAKYGCTLDELQYPLMENSILRNQFAARIYVYNYFSPLDLGEGYPRNLDHLDNLHYLYRSLSETAFGSANLLTRDQGLQDYVFDLEALALSRAIGQKAPKAAKAPKERSSKPVGVTSANREILTVTEADARYPEGYTTIKDLADGLKAKNVPVGRLVKAIGGDKGFGPLLTPNFQQFQIGGKRYLSNKVLEELHLLENK